MADALPQQYAALSKLLSTAKMFEARKDFVTVYWIRFHCVQEAMSIDSKSPECRKWLMTQMDWLEKLKKSDSSNEAITTELVGQSHMEQRGLGMFAVADRLDRQGEYGKNIVKTYFTSAMLMESLKVFGEMDEGMITKIKYAKFRATHIHSKMMKGEQPDPPFDDSTEDDEIEDPSDPVPDLGNVQINTQPTTYVPEPQQPTHYQPPQQPTQSYQPEPYQQPQAAPRQSGSSGFVPSTDNIARAQKLSKFAVSSLDYEDIPSAIDNLEKALRLLKTGSEN